MPRGHDSWLDVYRARRLAVEGGADVALVARALQAGGVVVGPSHEDLGAARLRFLAAIAAEPAAPPAPSRRWPSAALRARADALAGDVVAAAREAVCALVLGGRRMLAPAAVAAVILVAALVGLIGRAPSGTEAAMLDQVRALSRATNAALADGDLSHDEALRIEQMVGTLAALIERHPSVLRQMHHDDLASVATTLTDVETAVAQTRPGPAPARLGPSLSSIGVIASAARDALQQQSTDEAGDGAGPRDRADADEPIGGDSSRVPGGEPGAAPKPSQARAPDPQPPQLAVAAPDVTPGGQSPDDDDVRHDDEDGAGAGGSGDEGADGEDAGEPDDGDHDSVGGGDGDREGDDDGDDSGDGDGSQVGGSGKGEGADGDAVRLPHRGSGTPRDASEAGVARLGPERADARQPGGKRDEGGKAGVEARRAANGGPPSAAGAVDPGDSGGKGGGSDRHGVSPRVEGQPPAPADSGDSGEKDGDKGAAGQGAPDDKGDKGDKGPDDDKGDKGRDSDKGGKDQDGGKGGDKGDKGGNDAAGQGHHEGDEDDEDRHEGRDDDDSHDDGRGHGRD